MQNQEPKAYRYRWIILAVFMLVIILNQLLWITFAPVTIDAAKYYGVSDLAIGLLSMVFMIVFIIVSIPASIIIDKLGFRKAVGIGAGLTAIFGLLRGLMAHDYTMVLISQAGIAVGQPFILNAITKVASSWFPASGESHGFWPCFAGNVSGNTFGYCPDPIPGCGPGYGRHATHLRNNFGGCRPGFYGPGKRTSPATRREH